MMDDENVSKPENGTCAILRHRAWEARDRPTPPLWLIGSVRWHG